MNKYLKKLVVYVLILLLSNVEPVYSASSHEIKQALRNASEAKTEIERNYYLQQIVEFYKKEYEKDQNNIDTIIELANAYCYVNEKNEAKNTLMQAYATYTNNPKIYLALANYYFYFQEYNTALEFYKLTLSSGFLRNIQTNLLTARCYEKLGDKENAKYYYNIVLKLDSKNHEAKKQIHLYESQTSFKLLQPKDPFYVEPDDDNNIPPEIEKLIIDSSNLN